jgi:hypothetical protein
MEMQGYMNPVSAIEYTHFEDDWLHETVHVQAQGPNAQNVTVPLTAQDSFTIESVNSPYYQTIPATAPGTVTTDAYTPRDQDIIMFPNRVLALVTNVSGASFDATPLQAGDSIPTTTTSDEIVVIGNAHAEQSGQPLSRNGRVNRYTNNLMIKKSTNTVSGTRQEFRLGLKFQTRMVVWDTFGILNQDTKSTDVS